MKMLPDLPEDYSLHKNVQQKRRPSRPAMEWVFLISRSKNVVGSLPHRAPRALRLPPG